MQAHPTATGQYEPMHPTSTWIFSPSPLCCLLLSDRCWLLAHGCHLLVAGLIVSHVWRRNVDMLSVRWMLGSSLIRSALSHVQQNSSIPMRPSQRCWCIHGLGYDRAVMTIYSDRFDILGSFCYNQSTRFHTFVDDEFVYELATAYSSATGQCKLMHGTSTW